MFCVEGYRTMSAGLKMARMGRFCPVLRICGLVLCLGTSAGSHAVRPYITQADI